MKMLLVGSTLPYHLQASFTEKGLNQKSQHVSNRFSLGAMREKPPAMFRTSTTA